jgi:hypothetical protein
MWSPSSSRRNDMKRTLLGLILVAVVAMGSACQNNITGATLPVPSIVAGAWAGNARWDAVQGGAPAVVTSGASSAIIFQTGAAIQGGSTWEVTGMFTGTLSGTVDPNGNATGVATVLVVGVPCTASASFGGTVEGDRLVLTMSFADPGASPCPGAPVGMVLTLGR